jgi:flagellar basal-body rod modification protein FlgD
MAINGVNNTTGTDTAAAVAKTGNQQLGRDDFMKLLVAQLKNQDPNNPLDTKELVTQLSQLTSVEQLISLGTKMEDMAAATNGMAANQSAGLIGKTISGTADTATLGATGGVTSAVKLLMPASTAKVSVINEAGRVVQTFELDKTGAGNQIISWDGKTSSGERAASGTYKFAVDAKDKDGQVVGTDMTVSGIVSAVSYENGTPELIVGTTRVPLSNVTSIAQ